MRKIFSSLINYFVKGLLVVLPIGAAIYLIYFSISTIDSSLNLSKVILEDNKGHSIYVPGMGILSVVVVIMLAGVVVTNFITEPIKMWFSRWFRRLPLFSFIYSSIKDLTEAFVGEEKKFNEPVMVEVNEFGVKKIGFITQKDMKMLNLPGEVAVYFPFSYSFAGQLIIISADKVKHIDKNAGEIMKFVVSGGVSHLK
ncbi:MAG: DUF502 domain-containing protein [Sphingobacteriaceae bacterium]